LAQFVLLLIKKPLTSSLSGVKGSMLVVPPRLELCVYTLDNQLVKKTNGTHWVPTESVKAETLSRP